MSVRMEPDICPVCDYVFNCADSVSGENITPKEGDITFCLKCATILIFDSKVKVKLPTQEFFESIPVEIMIKLVLSQRLIRKMKAERN